MCSVDFEISVWFISVGFLLITSREALHVVDSKRLFVQWMDHPVV
jgi:hypothetical protein